MIGCGRVSRCGSLIEIDLNDVETFFCGVGAKGSMLEQLVLLAERNLIRGLLRGMSEKYPKALLEK